MMKRTGVPRLGPDDPAPLLPQSTAQIQASASSMHTLTQSAQPQILGATTAMLSVSGGGFARATRPGGGGAGGGGAPVINYLKPGAVQYAAKQPAAQVPTRLKQPSLSSLPGALGRQSPAPTTLGAAPHSLPHGQLPPHGPHVPHAPHVPHGPHAPHVPHGPHAPPAQFQRLKVEDALSYLDQVKYKFNTQPQVYNDFLDIMKEFKSQTIDTPGVITRVSNLFQGHPELIVGFNTFLPPGYKIEVQSNGEVSVSMPSPTGLAGGGVLLGVHHPPQPQLVHILPVNVAQSVSNAIVHNLSVTGAPTNTLHQISQAHQQIEAAAIHHQPGGVPPPNQPVEFNHAIEYVNKIKSRFSRQPDKYKRFLEILYAYQRGHRDVKEPQAKQQTEQEVYAQVVKLFENQDDLLAEFAQFLPDAKAVTKPPTYPPHARTPDPHPQPPLHAPLQRSGSSEGERFSEVRSPPPAHAAPPPVPPPVPPSTAPPVAPPLVAPSAPPLLASHVTHTTHALAQVSKHNTSGSSAVTTPTPQHHHLKRSPSFTSSTQIGTGPLSATNAGPPAKKARCVSTQGSGVGRVRDVSYAEAAKLATLHEYNFFDRAKKALRSQHVYDNFLRCLLLFTEEVISSSELVCVTAPFLVRHPELHRWLQDFLAPTPSPPHTPTAHAGYTNCSLGDRNERSERVERSEGLRYEPIGALGAALRHERPQGDAAMDIDLSTCKRLGTSYCALPRDAAARKCSGRTPLCKEVLNDTWVSFPSWSEDSTFVTSRKTQYEEYIYRCEDERFELDVVIETNAATIRVLEGVQKKLSRMSSEEAARYRLDECLGGHSPTIHQRALRRIYGDKVAVDIIAGLKKNPVVAVPVVLRRLKAKEEEWREAQKGFNKQWREQNEKYYLKSLDHQGINFKQNDLKAMRSKTLFNEVESAYATRKPGPHLVVDYNMQNRQEAIKIVRDAAELLIHHARRQTAIQKAEKRRIKQLLRQFLPDLFAHPRQPLSDDERDDEDKEDIGSGDSPTDVDDDKSKSDVKQEKQESSESDNASDKSGKNNKNNKENKPKNNNTTDCKDSTNGGNNIKRSSSNEGQTPIKTEIKNEAPEIEDDFREYPPNEARFVCTSSWYLFLRVHARLCQRLASARRAALALAEDERAERSRNLRPAVADALRLKPNNLPAEASSPSEYYSTLLELVKGVLDGNTEPAAFEDAAREMFGIKAYPAYTLDKLVSIAVRQLQHCVSESWSVRAAELAARGGMRGPPSYVRRAARFLREDHTAFLVKVYGGDECKVTFELLEGPGAGEGRASPHHNDNRLSPTHQVGRSGNAGAAVARLAAWSLYTERFARGTPPAVPPQARNKPVFLVRNARARGGCGSAHAAADPRGVHADPRGVHAPVTHARRKPPRLHDSTECTVTPALRCRPVAYRPLSLYAAGSLRAARASHARLHAARRARFRAWLQDRH